MSALQEETWNAENILPGTYVSFYAKIWEKSWAERHYKTNWETGLCFSVSDDYFFHKNIITIIVHPFCLIYAHTQ